MDQKRPVVIYQHGLLDSAATTCVDGLESMAFFLADCGFDVWLNNSRGNKFSRNHKHLDPDVHQGYWNFSFQELAEFDLPALFEFVLSQTKVQNVTYIGHS
jgi:pimeloyl-ACP methyl ester carboxylesterase